MKLQRHTAYKLNNGDVQYKYVVTIPEHVIDELGWKEGSELSSSVRAKSLLIRHVSDPIEEKAVAKRKVTYEQFRDRIKRALEYNDVGMTWTKLRINLQFDQVVPNNKWVRRLEKDIGLMRVKGVDGVILWRVNHAK